MSLETEGTVPRHISDEDLRWAGLNDWQVAYLSQATPAQREIVYREAIRMAMTDSGAIRGLGL